MKLDVAQGTPTDAVRRLLPRAQALVAAWPDRTQGTRTAAAAWFDERSRRERALLGVLAVVLTLALLVQLVWRPLIVARDTARADIARYDRIAAQLRAAGPDVARVAAARTGTLSTVVTERAAKAGLTIARIEPQGNQVAVSLDSVGFDAVVDWLAALDRDAGVIVVDLKVERRPDPGVVTAQVTLAER